MATKIYRVQSPTFDEDGLTRSIVLRVSNLDLLTLYIERNGKDVMFDGARLPLSVEGKIRRELPNLDKIGKKLRELK